MDSDHDGVTWAETDKETGITFPNVCPGWASRQPAILEAGQAYAAFDKGALASMFPYATHTLIEAILEIKKAFEEYNRQEIEASKRKAARKE